MRLWILGVIASVGFAQEAMNLDHFIISEPSLPTHSGLALESAPSVRAKRRPIAESAPQLTFSPPADSQPIVRAIPNLDHLIVGPATNLPQVQQAPPQQPQRRPSSPPSELKREPSPFTKVSATEFAQMKQVGGTYEDIALIDAIRRAGLKSTNGVYDPAICRVLKPYANKMSLNGQDGHAGFTGGPNSRFAQLSRTVRGANQFGEVTAESGEIFNRVKNPSVSQHASDCVRKWLGSAGHAQAISNGHKRYCYMMVKSQRDRDYVCAAIFGD